MLGLAIDDFGHGEHQLLLSPYNDKVRLLESVDPGLRLKEGTMAQLDRRSIRAFLSRLLWACQSAQLPLLL